jgi:DNA repair protein RecO (recombination protein O)
VPQERLYHTEAIVLHELDYGETDRILTLLTPRGKLSALAKGIRRPTSRKVGHLGLFYRVRVMLAKGHNLDIVTQAESVEEFEGVRNDLMRFTYACYVAELLERFAPEGEENNDLYALAVQVFRWLSQEQDPRLWVRFFELGLLRLSGYQPEVFSCMNCHAAIQPVVNFFSVEQGGMLCERCGQEQPHARAVSLAAQKVLRYLQTRDEAQVRTLRVSADTHREIEVLLRSYLEYTLERELRSVSVLERMRKELRGRQHDSADLKA